MKRGILWSVLLSIVGVGGALTAHAATYNSTNFSINGNLGDSAAGGQTSTSYQLTSAAGESIAGDTASKSYKLGQGYVSTLDNSLQLVTQPSGLAAYWPLDDASAGGPMVDESQNANNGFYEASSVNVAGKVGRAWNDLNTNQYGQAPDSASFPAGSAMTVSAWVNSSDLSNQRTIMSKWDYSVGGGTVGEWAIQLAPTAGQLRVFISSGSGDPGNNYVDTTNAGLTTATWYHVTMVYDGSQAAANRVKVYVNGTQTSTTVGGTIPTTLYAAGTNPVVIGNFPGLSRWWAGAIDEAKIYDRALTQNEIKAEYNAGNSGIPAGLALGAVTPGMSQTSAFDSIVQTSAGGYSLAINQNNNLQTGLSGASADFSQNFDSFGAGTTLTTGNTGFSALANSGGATFTSSATDPVHNTFGRMQTTSSSTMSAQTDYSATGSRYFRFYIRLASIPGSTQTVVNLRDAATNVVSAIRVQSDGTIVLRDGNLTTATSTATLSANQWARLELYYNSASSVQTLRIFTGTNFDGSVPTQVLNGAATNGSTTNTNFGIVTAQASQTLDLDEVATSTAGWLGPSGGTAIPSVSSNISSPSAWVEGTTKGLGFTLFSTNATAIPGSWGSGANYAAIPGSSTTFYSRTGYTGGSKDVLGMRLRLDVADNQDAGDYANRMTITGTMIP